MSIETIKVNEYANLEFGAFKVGTHDDLTTALGLACIWNYKGIGFTAFTISFNPDKRWI